MFVCLSVGRSVCLSIRSTFPSVCLFLHLSVCLTLSVCLSFRPFVCLAFISPPKRQPQNSSRNSPLSEKNGADTFFHPTYVWVKYNFPISNPNPRHVPRFSSYLSDISSEIPMVNSMVFKFSRKYTVY